LRDKEDVSLVGKSREAIDTIIGYYYQFDYYILQLLKLAKESDTVCIEGIEDVDISHLDETTAVQCKYYSKTEYNHSVIAKPIRLMLSHYAASQATRTTLQYKMYGNYYSGQEKLPAIIDISFAKTKLLTYTEKGVKHEHYSELGLSDDDISDFLNHLSIDINAPSFTEQEKRIITKIMETFSCNKFEAEYYYYNNALRVVKQLSTQHNIQDRIISKRDFISRINNKHALFDIWFLKIKGVKTYCQSVKAQYFSPRNVSPFERFFLIDCDSKISEVELKSLLLKISNNWSRLSKKEVRPFCPYIYLHNISENTLLNIKKALLSDDVYFRDGYDFKGSDFSSKSICKKATAYNEIKLKIINELILIDDVINSISATREIYQFFITEPYFVNQHHRHIQIQIEETKNISAMI